MYALLDILILNPHSSPFLTVVLPGLMANSSSARKRARQAETRRQHNSSLRSRLRTSIKNVIKAIEEQDKEQALKNYQIAVPLIDSSVSKKLIHKNKAARNKSRLNQQLRKIIQP